MVAPHDEQNRPAPEAPHVLHFIPLTVPSLTSPEKA